MKYTATLLALGLTSGLSVAGSLSVPPTPNALGVFGDNSNPKLGTQYYPPVPTATPLTAPGGATGTASETGSLRMRKLTVSVNPASADVGQTGNIWVVALIPPGSCAGANGGAFFETPGGGWQAYDGTATPAFKSGVTLANQTSVAVIDETASGIQSGPYLLRSCRDTAFYVGVGQTWQAMVDSRNFYIAGKAAWTTGINTVGSDDWEVENERLVKIAQAKGVTYGVSLTSALPKQTVVRPGDGVPNQYGSVVYYGLDQDDYIATRDTANIASQTWGRYSSCAEGGPSGALNCVDTLSTDSPNGGSHLP